MNKYHVFATFTLEGSMETNYPETAEAEAKKIITKACTQLEAIGFLKLVEPPGLTTTRLIL